MGKYGNCGDGWNRPKTHFRGEALIHCGAARGSHVSLPSAHEGQPGQQNEPEVDRNVED